MDTAVYQTLHAIELPVWNLISLNSNILRNVIYFDLDFLHDVV